MFYTFETESEALSFWRKGNGLIYRPASRSYKFWTVFMTSEAAIGHPSSDRSA
ncbi:hypothetical protein L7H23_01060 [Sphingopyxis sp. BSN-002]|uniref:hypothetical protein n=1 Tax=Sphingopyxis sp. BSN-002 TaxID=2911495 RepID=UPI001EDBE3F4|nr:hypothetical protein [Sphingopyxis sp. BSN-002]UKK84722.1 hypothetical protein L7H23_01060 [Sphingopyxis sp. BSN-002]